MGKVAVVIREAVFEQRPGVVFVKQRLQHHGVGGEGEGGVDVAGGLDPSFKPAALRVVKMGSDRHQRIGILGFSGEASTLTQQSITSKEISIFSSRLNSGRFPLVIDWMEKGLIRPEALITHCMPLEQVKEAMEIFANDRKTCCKVLLQLG